MSYEDKSFQLLLLEKISEIGERTARMEVEQKNMKEDLEEVKHQDRIQNELLAEHIRGVKIQSTRLDNEIQIRKTMEDQTLAIKSRVESLEVAPKFRATLRQYIIVIGAIAGAIVGIAKLLQTVGLL